MAMEWNNGMVQKNKRLKSQTMFVLPICPDTDNIKIETNPTTNSIPSRSQIGDVLIYCKKEGITKPKLNKSTLKPSWQPSN
jgi:hypothetical protein